MPSSTPSSSPRGGLSFFGIPVRFSPMFPILLILFGTYYYEVAGLTGFLVWAAVATLSIFVHELGHAAVVVAFGWKPEIAFAGLGGVTMWQPREGEVVPPWKRILVSLAGPFAGFALAAGAAMLGAALDLRFAMNAESPASLAYSIALLVNITWGIFNLLPIAPLDGGNVMLSAFEWVFGRTGVKVGRVLSIAIAAGLSLLAVSNGALYLAIIGALLAWQNIQALRMQSAFDTLAKAQSAPVDYTQLLNRAWAAVEKGDGATARAIAESLLAQARAPMVLAQAQELLAWGKVLGGDHDGARRALAGMPPGTKPDPALEGLVLLEIGRAADAIPKLLQAHERRATDASAMRLARAYVAAGQPAAAAALATDALSADALRDIQDRLFKGGAYDSAIQIGERVFARTGRAIAAYELACALARGGRPHDALRWLEKARDAGFADSAMIEGDADLAAVRSLTDYPEFRASVLRSSDAPES